MNVSKIFFSISLLAIFIFSTTRVDAFSFCIGNNGWNCKKSVEENGDENKTSSEGKIYLLGCKKLTSVIESGMYNGKPITPEQKASGCSQENINRCHVVGTYLDVACM